MHGEHRPILADLLWARAQTFIQSYHLDEAPSNAPHESDISEQDMNHQPETLRHLKITKD